MIRRRRSAPPYKLLSVCLRYPDERVCAARDELAAAAAGDERLERFAAYLLGSSPAELQAAYVETFDLRRRTSLYLGYYLHGDTRKRGVALLGLRRLYRAVGLEQADGELPDYLPLVLEFCSFAPPQVAERLLSRHRAALELLRDGLHERESPYADLLDALVAGLPRLGPVERERVRTLAAEGPPAERVGLQPFAPPETMPEPGARA